jgi:hypothetical protein
VTQKQPGGIVALTAQTQQILVRAHRQIQFAAVPVIDRLSKGNPKELRGGRGLGVRATAGGTMVLSVRRSWFLWIFYSAQIFLVGAEFTKVYAHHYGSRVRTK